VLGLNFPVVMHIRSLKVAVQGLDFMAHPLYIHTYIRVVILHLCKKEKRNVVCQNVTQVNDNMVHGSIAVPIVNMCNN
jgi:hypothetical protein